MSQMEECVLEIPLQDGEKVLFVEERNVQRGRVIHSIIAILFAVAGIFGVKTVIVPIVALVVIVLCFYFRIRPASDIPGTAHLASPLLLRWLVWAGFRPGLIILGIGVDCTA